MVKGIVAVLVFVVFATAGVELTDTPQQVQLQVQTQSPTQQFTGKVAAPNFVYWNNAQDDIDWPDWDWDKAFGNLAKTNSNTFFMSVHGAPTTVQGFGGDMQALWNDAKLAPGVQTALDNGQFNQIGLVSCYAGKLDVANATPQKLANVSGLPVYTHPGDYAQGVGENGLWDRKIENADGTNTFVYMSPNLAQAIKDGDAKVYLPDPDSMNSDGTLKDIRKPAKLYDPKNPENNDGWVFDEKTKKFSKTDGTNTGGSNSINSMFNGGHDPTDGYKSIA